MCWKTKKDASRSPQQEINGYAGARPFAQQAVPYHCWNEGYVIPKRYVPRMKSVWSCSAQERVKDNAVLHTWRLTFAQLSVSYRFWRDAYASIKYWLKIRFLICWCTSMLFKGAIEGFAQWSTLKLSSSAPIWYHCLFKLDKEQCGAT
jgi:hypothetical protein